MKLLLVLVVAVPLLGQSTCTYYLTPSTIEVGPDGSTSSGTTNIKVTAPEGCAWSAGVPVNVSWIHIGFIVGGSGNGEVGWSVDRNSLPSPRGGSISIANQTITVTQSAASCGYRLAADTASFPGSGGPGSVNLQTNCSWTAAGSTSWITVVKGIGGVASATVGYTVAANPCANPRSGALVVGLPGTSIQQYLTTLAISQDGGPNAMTLAPASLSLSNGALDGFVTIATPTGCTWTASSDVSWVQLSAPLSGNGAGQVRYHVLANTSVARTGNIHIGPLVVPVSQQGAPAPTVQVTAVKSAASYAADAVSPGEIVALGGVNIGPATPALLQLASDGLSVTKTLGGVQVLFDGTPAAMIYASSRQVNAVVPYGVAGKDSTQVQIQYNGATSGAFAMRVQAATPAIFTQDASGIGPGAILNQNYQVNSAASRAGRGEVVMIFCTGGGTTDPTTNDAAVIAPPYPQLLLPVAVTIGGMDAPVVYHGAAPGAVAGLIQINAQVPADVTPGAALPISVKIGDWTSQSGVTIAVK